MVDKEKVEDEGSFRTGKARVVGGKSVIRSRVVFSKDSRFLFCSYGNQIRVYSVKTGELVSIFKGHTGVVSDLCLSERNPLQLLSCCLDGGIIFWDILDGSILTKCRSKCPLHGISVHKDHPDTLFLVQENEKSTGTKKENTKDKETARFCFGKASVSPKNKGLKKVTSNLRFKRICKIEKCTGTYSFSTKGELVASVLKNYLQVWNFGKQQLKKYHSRAPLVSVAFHPFDSCLATGDDNGKITIWKNLGIDVQPVCTQLHWHAHAVESLTFTNDGAYLYSGGEESVLVFWQFETGLKQFKPRLGAPISYICNSKDDTLIATCHTDNVINIISAVDRDVVNVLQGLTKANHVYTGLVADPRSKSLVLNSQDGVLQFYRPDTDSLAFTLDIVRQNYISRPKDEPLQMTKVEQVSFSKNGNWLATVERRDDGKTTPEIRLKFWKFVEETQRHVLNTCIDPPHEEKVIAVEFQPGSFEDSRAMTAALDGKFKIWILKEQQEIKCVKEAWQCQSVGYLRDEKVEDATFSSDGSLLAVGYGQVVTLWDPCTNELKKTLYSPLSQVVRQIRFGRQSCSHILLASTKRDFLVSWNLLSCSVLWSVKTEAFSILPDPLSHLMAVFVSAPGRRVHLYIFDPRSPVPVAIHGNALRNANLATAGFQPNMKGLTVRTNNCNVTLARLFYMNTEQVLFTIDDDEETDDGPSTKETCPKPEESEFYRIFGEVHESGLQPDVPEDLTVHINNTSSSKVVREMLTSPSHVLPPVSTLCSTFLRSLLISKNPDRNGAIVADNDSDEDQEMNTKHDGSTSNEETVSVKNDIVEHSRDLVARSEMVEKTKELYSTQMINELHESSFDWMKDLFDKIS